MDVFTLEFDLDSSVARDRSEIFDDASIEGIENDEVSEAIDASETESVDVVPESCLDIRGPLDMR